MRTASRAFARGLMRSSAACPCCEPVSAVCRCATAAGSAKCAASGPGEHVGRCAGHDHVHDEHCGHGAEHQFYDESQSENGGRHDHGPARLPTLDQNAADTAAEPDHPFEGGVWSARGILDADRLTHALKSLPRAVIRVKVWVVTDRHGPVMVHLAAAECVLNPCPRAYLKPSARRARNARQRTGLHRPQGIEPTRSCRRCACAACGKV